MTERDDRFEREDRLEREPLSRRDLQLVAVVARYVDARERGAAVRLDDVLAVAAEFGDGAAARVRAVIALYERICSDEQPGR
jgi:hypothetical protein